MALRGAIIGDIIGSQYEFKRPAGFDYKTADLLTDKCRFTDDTVMSLATKYAVKHCWRSNGIDFTSAYDELGNRYINVGYGSYFKRWLKERRAEPYGSYGNGSAMRVSYIGECFDSISDVDTYAALSAACTHNHPEGILGATVTAHCIWMAKHNYTKEDILAYASVFYPKKNYAFSCMYPLDEIRETYHWDVTCQGSVPAAIRCVYEANNYTEFVRNVFSLNCDTDTLCAIGGGIAEELFDNETDEIMKQKDRILEKYLDDYLLGIVKS